MENELELIKKCQKNPQEFGPLYDAYIEKIYKFIYYKTQHKETAEDLTSQTFFKAISKLKSFNPAKGTFQAWLYQIARNTVIDFYRAKKTENNIDDIYDLHDENDIERDTEIKIKLEEVDKYLKNLKSDQREILVLRLWENLSYQEIAQITGKTEASCKMNFIRTINKLRAEMPLYLFLALLLNSKLLS